MLWSRRNSVCAIGEGLWSLAEVPIRPLTEKIRFVILFPISTVFRRAPEVRAV